jgi:hypothetical protein
MDTNLELRDGSSDLTANETLTNVVIGPMVKPLWLHVLTEDASETDDKLDTELEFCTADAPTTQVMNENAPQMSVDSAGQHMAIPFIMPPGLTSLQVKLAVTDADAGGDFNAGGVKVWIDTTNRYAGPYSS